MSFHTSTPSAFDPDSAGEAIRWLRQGFYAQAFVLLSKPQMEKNPAARFASGLCHLYAEELDAAVSCFEQALRLIKSAPPQPAEGAESSETHRRLAQKQIEEKAYLTPMNPDFCVHFPKAAEQMILLALIHVYRQKDMADQAQKLAAGLTGPIFEEYKAKLREDIVHGLLHD